jgi:hypothetical protein
MTRGRYLFFSLCTCMQHTQTERLHKKQHLLYIIDNSNTNSVYLEIKDIINSSTYAKVVTNNVKQTYENVFKGFSNLKGHEYLIWKLHYGNWYIVF